MKTIGIMALKQIIQGLRDFQTMLIMIAMPLLFLVVLQSAFSAPIQHEDQLSQVTIRYHLEEGSDAREVGSLLEPLKRVYTHVTPFDSADYDPTRDMIIRFQDQGRIGIYYDHKLEDQVKFLEVMLKNSWGHAQKRTTQTQLEYVQVGLNEKDALMRYYAITMLTLTIMFASVSGAYSMIKEREASTLYKLRTMPCKMHHILIGKSLGGSLVVLLQISLVMYLIQVGFGINWGNHSARILTLLWSEGLFAITLGMWLGIGLKDHKSAWLILLLMIMGAGFLAGAFVPLGQIQMAGFEKWGTLLPLTGINQALFGVVYSGQYQQMYPTLLLNFVLSGSLLGLTAYRMEAST